MITTLVAALAISTSAHPAEAHACDSCTAGLEPEVALIVESAWQEKAAQDKQTRDQQRHKEELKNDVELGAKYAAQAEKELKPSKNQEFIDRVNRIGNELGAIANNNLVRVLWGDKRLNTYEYKFRVVEKDEVNAFSLPGGFIFVYEGLLKFTESDDELAGVLAHEIAHASFRHLATLQREQSKLDVITLPLILVSLIAGGEQGAAGVTLGTLTNQAKASGWSQQAEMSADYGGFQYMAMSKYNPVGLLTFMEKLAREQSAEFIDWGIYRSHPPSRERAAALETYLRQANIPIRRSEVSASFRTTVRKPESGPVELIFNRRRLFPIGGNEAEKRAESLAVTLNGFFDEVPSLVDVRSGQNGRIYFRNKLLFQFTPDDAEAAGVPLDVMASNAVRSIKRELYTLAFRVWDSR